MWQFLVIPLLLILAGGCGQSSNEREANTNQERTGWRKLSKGMTQNQVRAILGEPLRMTNQGEVTCWYYQEGQPLERNAADPGKWVIPRGSLLFSTDRAGAPKLTEWREP